MSTESGEAVERVTGFLNHMFTPDGMGDVIRAYSSGGVQYLLTEGDLRAVLAGYEEVREKLERLVPREVLCPVCGFPRKLTANGLIRYHGPRSLPCRASGTLPELWLSHAELAALLAKEESEATGPNVLDALDRLFCGAMFGRHPWPTLVCSLAPNHPGPWHANAHSVARMLPGGEWTVLSGTHAEPVLAELAAAGVLAARGEATS